MAWTPELPRDIEKLKDTPSQLRAMWAEIALGTDPALLITNDKISPTAAIADTKLAQITTAGKISGAALTSLASIPSGAGQIPIANIPNLAASKITSGTIDISRLPYGTTADKLVKLDGDAKLPAVDGSLLTNILPSNLSIASQSRGDLLYFNGSIWTRLAKGTTGQFLIQGANDPAWGEGGTADGSVTNIKLGWYSVGAVLLASADTGGNTNSSSYVKVKEIQIARYGTLTVKFDLQRVGGDNGYGRIYRNGVAVGTEQVETTGNWVTKTENIAGWSPGDLCQLYVHKTSTSNLNYRNFRIYSSEKFYYTESVTLDT